MDDFPLLPILGGVVLGTIVFIAPAWVWWLVGGFAALYVIAWILSELDLFDTHVPFFFHFGGSGRRSARRAAAEPRKSCREKGMFDDIDWGDDDD